MAETVLILGAHSEIALAIAKKFASKQYNLQLAARNVHRLGIIKESLQTNFNIVCTLHEFDAIAFSSHQSFFESLPQKPSITICVFGAMLEEHMAFLHFSDALQMIHTNFTGAVSILNIIANFYAKQKSGCIVGISSVAGERGRATKLIYASSKAGFTTYLSGLRQLLYKHAVHVATINPGYVYTKMLGNFRPPALLTATPTQVGQAVFVAVQKKKNIVYVKWMWRWIMFGITIIPERIFKKMKL